MIACLVSYFRSQTSIAPLISFRVLFGFIMTVSIVRFMVKGWVYDLYIKPQVFFSYYGFEWVKPLSATGMYILFSIMLVAAIGIMLGLYYRIAALLFFLSFTYVELIDKTNYLNHYYFVSLISFLLIWVPAHRSFSLDVFRIPSLNVGQVPRWAIGIFKLQLAIVYFYAGIAKLNYDWLVEAMPLRIWLPANSHIPVLGDLFTQPWAAYAFSWFGALYDLFIVFFLLTARTRVWAYGAVVVFHLLTWWLFPIGMFPFIMMLSTLIFFSARFHERLIQGIKRLVRYSTRINTIQAAQPIRFSKVVFFVMIFFFAIQVVAPWRYIFYPGQLFWTEQGYRFSWRVMLMEKAGYVTFHIKDPVTGREGDVMPADYLTPIQVKMMATQPDMILQFAHFLKKELQKKGLADPEVRAEAYVTLNGSGSRLFIDPTLDLTNVQDSFKNKEWILAFQHTQ